MSENNLPPFYVGQKVVCIESFRIKEKDVIYPKVNDKLTVSTIELCESYKLWVIRFYEIKNPVKDYREGWVEARFGASKFRAIQENFESISLEKVLEQETKLISVN